MVSFCRCAMAALLLLFDREGSKQQERVVLVLTQVGCGLAAAAAAAAQLFTVILIKYPTQSPLTTIGRINLIINLSSNHLLRVHFHLVTLPCLLWQHYQQ
jgi:phosphoribosyl-dephospho-CoA transferase